MKRVVAKYWSDKNISFRGTVDMGALDDWRCCENETDEAQLEQLYYEADFSNELVEKLICYTLEIVEDGK